MRVLGKFKPNLLPPQVKRIRRQRFLFSMIRIALTVSWIMVLIYSFWLYYQYTYLKDLVLNKEQTFNKLTEQLQKENPLKVYKEAEAFFKELKTFTAGLFPLYEFLLPLSANFPQGLRLEKIEAIGEREVKIYGFASSPTALAEFVNVVRGISVVRSVSLPGLESEVNGEIPFNFICKLKEWW